MKRKRENGQRVYHEKSKNNLNHLKSFTAEMFQDYIFQTENKIRETLKVKNAAVENLLKINNEVREELKQKNTQIEDLHKEKAEFVKITFAEVEQFDLSYQSSIDKLETEKKEMLGRLSKQEEVIKNFQSQNYKTRDAVLSYDASKIEKLMKKYKELKIKLKSKDLEMAQHEQQKSDLRKHIDSLNDIIKMKDAEKADFNQKAKEKENKLADLSTMLEKQNSENTLLKVKFNAKDVEISNLKLELREKSVEINSVKEDRLELKEESQNLKNLINSNQKEHSDALNNRCKEYEEELRMKDENLKIKDAELIELKKSIRENSSSVELESWTLICKNLEESLKNKDSELDHMKKVLSDRSKDVSSSNEVGKKLSDECRRLENVIKSRGEYMEIKNTENADLKIRLEEEKSKYVSLLQKIKTMEMELKNKDDINKQFTHACKKKDDDLKLLNQQTREQQEVIKLKNDEIIKMEGEVDAFLKQYEEVKLQSRNAVDTLNKNVSKLVQAKADIVIREEHIDWVEKENQDFKKELGKLENEVKVKNELIKSQEVIIKDLEDKLRLRRLKFEQDDSQPIVLGDDKGNLEDMASSNASKADEILQLTQNLEVEQKERLVLMEKLTTKQIENEVLKSSLLEKDSILNEENKTWKKISIEEFESINKSTMEDEKKLKSLEEKLKAKETEIETLKTILDDESSMKNENKTWKKISFTELAQISKMTLENGQKLKMFEEKLRIKEKDNEDYKSKLMEKDEELVEITNVVIEKEQTLATIQKSVEDIREKFRKEFDNMVTIKDDKIKKLEEKNSVLVKTKNGEFSERHKEHSSGFLKVTENTGADKDIYSKEEKRLGDIVKALEHNNSKLIDEVKSLKFQLSSQCSSRKNSENSQSIENQKWSQKYEALRSRVLDLQSEKVKLEQTVKELSEEKPSRKLDASIVST